MWAYPTTEYSKANLIIVLSISPAVIPNPRTSEGRDRRRAGSELLCASWSNGCANESRQQNDGLTKLDILRHSSSKVIMNSNKYIWVLLGSFAAMALFAACQQQGSTATTPAASSTEMRQVRSRSQTASASTNRNIAPGGTRRAPTPSPTP
jgi:hypothetical protein